MAMQLVREAPGYVEKMPVPFDRSTCEDDRKGECNEVCDHESNARPNAVHEGHGNGTVCHPAVEAEDGYFDQTRRGQVRQFNRESYLSRVSIPQTEYFDTLTLRVVIKVSAV